MKQRCLNERNARWHRYGGRGIRVCAGLLDFEAFLAVLGERPDGLSLDRIDNDGHYCCGGCDECKRAGWSRNVRWATWEQQYANR